MLKKQIRVLIVDDHTIFRSGLKLLLEGVSDITVCGEADSSKDAILKCNKLKPDIILLDISMPDMNGILAIRKLLEQNKSLKIIMLTMYEKIEYLKEALKAGAKGYVIKRAADSELIDAIRIVSKGEVYIHPKITKEFIEKSIKDTPDELSPREKEVLVLLSQGFTNKEVADKLDISMKTVETYRARIMGKLGLSSRAQLLQYAIEKGWFKPDIY